MIQRFPVPCRTQESNPDINVADATGISSGSAGLFVFRTGGATQVDHVDLTPPLRERWRIVSIAVGAFLGFQYGRIGAGAQVPLSGKLGPITTGLVAQTASPTSSPNGDPSVPRIVPPGDDSFVTKLWDPAADPMPPMIAPAGATSSRYDPSQLLRVSAAINLPVPVEVDGGDRMGVGIWLGRSIIQAVFPSNAANTILGLTVIGAQYTLVYDDGR